MQGLRAWARGLKRDVIVLWLAARDPRTPLLAKALAGLVAAYALSPIDLIPDFIPVFGYLDDLILAPLGVWACLRLIPPALLAELRLRGEALATRPTSRLAAAAIIAVWIGVSLVAAVWLLRRLPW
jgi:uncharacterized membrane protein YkvA (DUF1232 family)